MTKSIYEESPLFVSAADYAKQEIKAEQLQVEVTRLKQEIEGLEEDLNQAWIDAYNEGYNEGYREASEQIDA